MTWSVLPLLGLFALRLRASEPLSAGVPADNFSRPQIIEHWGWLVAHEQKVAGAELTATELERFLHGAAANAANQPAGAELNAIFPDVERLAEARRAKISQAIEQKNLAASRAFFSELKKKPGVVVLPSGLCFEIIKPGTGTRPDRGRRSPCITPAINWAAPSSL